MRSVALPSYGHIVHSVGFSWHVLPDVATVATQNAGSWADSGSTRQYVARIYCV